MSELPSAFAIRPKWRPVALSAASAGAVGFSLLLSEMSLIGAALGAAMLSACSAGLAELFLSWQLWRQNRRLRVVLDNMTQGLCMFDAAERLAVMNKTYMTMYKLSDQVVKPGLSLNKLLEYRTTSGSFSRDITEYRKELVDAMRGGRMTGTEVRSPDGRLIAVRNRPMLDGGWVATHEDITDRRGAESERTAMQKFEARRATIEAAISNFRGRVEKHLHQVTGSTETMRSTASGLFASSGQAAERAQSAVAASNEAATNVETAAVAAEQLNGSIV